MALIEEVGERIRMLRKSAGLTMEEAASRVGMDGIFWGKVERGQTNASLDTIERMIEALGIDPVDIFAYVGMPPWEGEEKHLVELYRSMSPETREQIMSLAKFLRGL